MNNPIIHIARFIVLVLIQVLVLNNVNLFGYLNPYIYILFIILLPATLNQNRILIFSFLIGLTMDMFGDSGGVHACACLVIAYLRPLVLRFSFGISYDYQTLRFNNIPFGARLNYIVIMVFLHHFVMFALEIFNISDILTILKKTLFNGLFSALIIVCITILFSRKRI